MTGLIRVGCVLLFALLPLTGVAQETDGDEMTDTAVDDMMAQWMETITPGEMHERLDYFVGDWEFESTMYMMGPDGPPTAFPPGTASFEWVFDGRFLKGDVQGPMGDGTRYENISYMGYDNFRKLYTLVTIGNMATSINTASGHWVEDENLFLLYQEMNEPMTGEVGKMAIHIYRIIDDDHFVFEAADPVYGVDYNVVVRIEYTRVP